MLEPSTIHSYEPPAYRSNPPSPSEGLPPSLPFHCAVLESADACGGPSPALLHSLREQGCKLILAQVEDVEEEERSPPRERVSVDTSPLKRNSAPKAYRPTSLNREWFDAVFDKVLAITGEEGGGNSPLERFFADEGTPSSQAVCFACSDAGSKAFGAVDAGLVLAPGHDKVWRRTEEEDVIQLPGADCALSQSPTARQLAWLHEVFTQKLWCCCMWLAPAPEELRHNAGLPSDSPSAYERATITSVASGTLQALGHPPWASRWETWQEGEETYPCMAALGDEMCACPDWTPLEPRFRCRGTLRELVSLPKVVLYCHSLDVGLAKVHHLIEAQDVNGLVVRVSSNRLCSLCREGTAGTEMSVTLVACNSKNWPDICIRSSLLCKHLPKGFTLYGLPSVDISRGKAMLTAAYQDEQGQIVLVRAWHRVCKDDGRGDVELNVGGDMNCASSVHAQKASAFWGTVRKDACEVDIIFCNPRRGTRYTVEKVVSVIANSGRLRLSLGVSVPTNRFQKFLSRADSVAGEMEDGEDEPLTLPEVEEEHCSAWRAEWDKADIELAGTRKAARFQRAVRLFRFHQVSRDEAVGIGGRKKTKVHSLVRALFKNLLQDLCWDSSGDRPSSIVTSRVLVHDPRTPPVVRIEPKVPPDCHRMRFNAALGWRWHRFTLSPGKVQILVQGPILVSQTSGAGRCRSGAPSRSLQEAQLHGDTVNQPPKFIIPTNDGEDGVEVKAKPWHEVQVQYALTDLGRPDGSTGGFYGLMRRTRFIKLEVLRRLFAEDPEGVYRPGLEGDFRDETLTQPLHNALASLESAPRPPGWNPGDDADLHVLEADSTMRTRMLLQYEKNELKRDILFLMGRFEQREGRLQVPGSSSSEDILVETMTVHEAMSRCHTLRGCAGFCFQGDMTESAVKIHFKGFGHEAVGTGWTSFFFEDGESALVKLLAEQYKASEEIDWRLTQWCCPFCLCLQKRFLGFERSCRAATWAASLWSWRAEKPSEVHKHLCMLRTAVRFPDFMVHQEEHAKSS
ncbi:unnamed protein product [Symbiodinium natans]|uniref:Uncharacterized protein n=1 Tax=Symbiodinium natans TaxID=878477 RepID=A0A812UAS8_9DINO|nr:unnamed protein product [Symbiodinium natans]